jgi:vacuolar-type H+-ATPase catalytic subunit A/Vma1
LDKINNELTNFIESKSKLSQLLKDQHKTALAHIDTLDLPDLSLFLQDKYVMKPRKFACDMCDRTFDTRAQMSAHKKKHTKKDEVVNSIVSMKQDVDEVLPETNEFNNMNLSQLKEECKRRHMNISGKKRDELIQLLIKHD